MVILRFILVEIGVKLYVEVEMDKILIYSTDTCPHCQSVKSYLDSKGFSYEEKNVQKDKEARKELLSKGYRGVPVIIINGQDVVGFDKEKIDQILKL